MKKRKPPIILAAILVVALGAVIMMNAAANAPADADHHDEPVTEAPRSTDSKESILKPTTDENDGAQPLQKGSKSPSPRIERKQRMDKPVPTGTELQGQWYTDEAADTSTK